MPVSPIGDPVPRHGFRGEAKFPRFPRTMTIAVSRQAGARGGTIARHVGQRLGWQVIDQDLIEYIVREGSAERELPAPRASGFRQGSRNCNREVCWARTAQSLPA